MIKSIPIINEKTKKRVSEQIWMELLFMIGLTLIVSGSIFLVVSHAINGTSIGRKEHITYNKSRLYIQNKMLEKAAELNKIDNLSTAESVETMIKQILEDKSIDKQYVRSTVMYLVDSKGELIVKNKGIDSIDLIKVIQKANQSESNKEYHKFVAIYPISLNNKVYYLYNESTLEPFYDIEYTDLGNILGFIAAAGAFIIIIFRESRGKIAYIEYLCNCLGEISKGDLDYHIQVIGEDELAQVARSISHMEEQLKEQLEKRLELEQSKNELITNIAHDLRTPLTSIIGYISVIKEKRYQTDEEKDKYLDIIYHKSEQLKELITDLLELVRLHQKNMELNKKQISVNHLLEQLIEELIPLADDKKIGIETYIEKEDTTALIDGEKMIRVFENLIENAIKYTKEEETIYIELKEQKDYLYIAISNPVENIEIEEIHKYFRRFYRGDHSRNSKIEGSGLGLSIAKNIVELHGGMLKAEIIKDLLSFKIILPR